MKTFAIALIAVFLSAFSTSVHARYHKVGDYYYDCNTKRAEICRNITKQQYDKKMQELDEQDEIMAKIGLTILGGIGVALVGGFVYGSLSDTAGENGFALNFTSNGFAVGHKTGFYLETSTDFIAKEKAEIRTGFRW